MKYFLLLILTFCVVDASEAFQKGIEAYHESEYTAASAAFEQAIGERESGGARHNLSLSYLQEGKPSEAVWQMERALKLDPRNKQYHFKLGALRQQLGLNPTRPKWYELATQVISINAWLLLLCTSFWAAFAAFLLPRCAGLAPNLPIKTIRGLSLTLLVLASLSLYLTRNGDRMGTILAEAPVDLHAAPANAAPQSGLARPGERAQLIGQFEEFVEIETEGGAQGWVSSEEFRLIQ